MSLQCGCSDTIMINIYLYLGIVNLNALINHTVCFGFNNLANKVSVVAFIDRKECLANDHLLQLERCIILY